MTTPAPYPSAEAPPEGRATAPLVSVVIPAYNRASTIGAAIESVLRQTWTDFELVIVDDGSEDGTLAAAAAVADPRIRLIDGRVNRGASAARNRGAAEARGTWIAFQDSDDEWLPEKLKKQMARLTADTADFVAGYCGLLTLGWIDDAPDTRLSVRYVPGPSATPAEGDIRAPLLWDNMISTQTLVVRRDIFHALGGFDARLPAFEDWDFAIRLAGAGRVAFVDEPLVHQRFSGNSLTRNRAAKLEARIRLVAQNRAAFAKAPALLARQYRYIADACLRERGDSTEARRWLVQALRADAANPKSLYHGIRLATRWMRMGWPLATGHALAEPAPVAARQAAVVSRPASRASK